MTDFVTGFLQHAGTRRMVGGRLSKEDVGRIVLSIYDVLPVAKQTALKVNAVYAEKDTQNKAKAQAIKTATDARMYMKQVDRTYNLWRDLARICGSYLTEGQHDLLVSIKKRALFWKPDEYNTTIAPDEYANDVIIAIELMMLEHKDGEDAAEKGILTVCSKLVQNFKDNVVGKVKNAEAFGVKGDDAIALATAANAKVETIESNTTVYLDVLGAAKAARMMAVFVVGIVGAGATGAEAAAAKAATNVEEALRQASRDDILHPGAISLKLH